MLNDKHISVYPIKRIQKRKYYTIQLLNNEVYIYITDNKEENKHIVGKDTELRRSKLDNMLIGYESIKNINKYSDEIFTYPFKLLIYILPALRKKTSKITLYKKPHHKLSSDIAGQVDIIIQENKVEDYLNNN